MNLEEAQKEDFKFIYQLAVDFFKTDLNVTYLEMESYTTFINRIFKKGTNHYIVFENDERIGYVHILKNEIGYFLLPEYRGKGFGVRAVKKLMELNPKKMYFAIINKNNYASLNLVKKLGFESKGVVYVLRERNT